MLTIRIPAILLMSFLAFGTLAATSQAAPASQPQSQPPSGSAPALSVVSVISRSPAGDGYRDDPTTDAPLTLGENVRLKVTNLSDWINAGNSPWNLTLFLNERPMKGLHPISVDKEQGYVSFLLQRDEDNIPAWESLMEKQRNWQWGKVARHLRASVGMDGGLAVASNASFYMVFLPRTWFIFVLAAVVLSLCLLVILGRRTALLKSSAKGPYSLGRTQMAVWSWLTLNAYIYLFALTHDPAVEIPVSVLGLLGISATTYVAAAMVDRATPGGAPEISHGFWRDISGGSEVSLHRLQMMGWTGVLAVAFVAEVVNNLSIPDFNPTLLGLMGLSAGTYVGFKFPENQSDQPKPAPQPQVKTSTTAAGT